LGDLVAARFNELLEWVGQWDGARWLQGEETVAGGRDRLSSRELSREAATDQAIAEWEMQATEGGMIALVSEDRESLEDEASRSGEPRRLTSNAEEDVFSLGLEALSRVSIDIDAAVGAAQAFGVILVPDVTLQQDLPSGAVSPAGATNDSEQESRWEDTPEDRFSACLTMVAVVASVQSTARPIGGQGRPTDSRRKSNRLEQGRANRMVATMPLSDPGTAGGEAGS
jgi:hypothetical protein